MDQKGIRNDPTHTAPQARYAATASGAGLAGAALTFLLVSQSEDAKQDTQVLEMLASQSERIELVLQNQDDLRGKMAVQDVRMHDWEARVEEMAERQRDLQQQLNDLNTGQIRLRDDVTRDIREKVGWTPGATSYGIPEIAANLTVLMREIATLEIEGDEGVWTARGAPYADVGVLSRRLNRRVTADDRDQAAALLTTARELNKAKDR